ncbi:hypothetical protein GCM10017750_51150 [Streptomyces racemochromogenes]
MQAGRVHQPVREGAQVLVVGRGLRQPPGPLPPGAAREAQGQRQGPGGLAASAQLCAEPDHEAEQLGPGVRAVQLLAGEPGADGGGGGQVARGDRARVDPAGPLGREPAGPFAEDPLDDPGRDVGERPDGVQPVPAQRLGLPGAEPVQLLHRERVQEARHRLRGHGQHPAGPLDPGGCHGRHRPGGGDPDPDVGAQPGHRAQPDHLGDAGGVGAEVPLGAADLDQRGARRQGLDERGELAQQLQHLAVALPGQGGGAADVQHAGRCGGAHPALPGLECHSLRPVAARSPGGWRSAQGFIS